GAGSSSKRGSRSQNSAASRPRRMAIPFRFSVAFGMKRRLLLKAVSSLTLGLGEEGALPVVLGQFGEDRRTEVQIMARDVVPGAAGVVAAATVVTHALGVARVAEEAVDRPDHRARVVVGDQAV